MMKPKQVWVQMLVTLAAVLLSGHTMAHSEIPNNGMPADVAIATWDQLDSFAWPDPTNPERYVSIAARLARPQAEGKYCHLGWFIGLYDTVYGWGMKIEPALSLRQRILPDSASTA